MALGYAFGPSLQSGRTLFLNDGPLGALKADYNKTPDAFFGVWQDLNWVGSHGGSLLPSFTFGQFLALGPVGFSKFHAPVALFVLGVSVWFACRALGFHSAVCVLTGLAAALNMNVFSNACWGLSSRPFALAMAFLAVAAIGTRSPKNVWLRCALAGLAVGMGITEGADVGVIFSVFIGAFGVYYFIFRNAHPNFGSVLGAGARVAVVVLFAGFMAWHIIDALVFRAKVLDAVASQKQIMSPEQQWDWATQWSLPKAESFRVIIPGLHGYRMDSPNGGRYWGTAGRDPHWEDGHRGFPRFSGAGEYAGVTVVLFGVFALAQALRRQGNVFVISERRLIYFWTGVAVVTLLFAWGRFAPFYRLIYSLPYFSTFRNPIKWTHILHLALLMLFAYGLQALWRGYLSKAAGSRDLGEWWKKLGDFDRKWVYAMGAFLAISVLGWMLYITSTGDLVRYLSNNAVASPGEAADNVVREVAHFSQREVGLYLLFLVLSVGAAVLGMSGVFAGSRAPVFAAGLALLILVDLTRANMPWVKHYNYEAKYASNGLLDFLRNQPGHQRVTVAPFGMNELGNLQQIYHVEWMQQQFPYYNIPSIDIIQDPRPLPENIQFREKLQQNPIRMWELTSTRYVIALAGGFADQLSQQLDRNRGRFKEVLPFTLFNAGEESIGVTTNTTGPYAVLEFTGALPRANFFSRWDSPTNDEAVLNRLADPTFNPAEQVLISSPSSFARSVSFPSSSTNAAEGSVKIQDYKPKRIQLASQSSAPGVVMLTDKFDADWQVFVDGQRAPLLRCDYLMRGVSVPAGSHQIEFVFKPSTTGLYVSLAAIGTGLLFCCVLVVTRSKKDELP